MTNNGKPQNPALKLDVLIWHPSYGGNGGISSEVPDIREWEVETVLQMKSDPRVGKIHQRTVADTPITMVRNQAVVEARRLNAHLILMVDSDQNPNLWKTFRGGKPFWDVAFDSIYEHYGKGPLVVGAPYCGPPPHENIYVFQWDNEMKIGDETRVRLDQYTRAEAFKMHGVQECAALPTGMILYDVRAFELIEPGDTGQPGWFYYDWTDSTASQKASTEDVTNTRNIALAGCVKLGYNPLRCAWDCWVGHWKPWCVGRPELSTTEHISEAFKRTVLANRQQDDSKMEIDFLDKLGVDRSKINQVERGDIVEVPSPTRDAIKSEHIGPEARKHLYHNKYFSGSVDWPVCSYGHMNPADDYFTLSKLLVAARKAKSKVTGVPYSQDGSGGMTIVEIGSWVGESALAMAIELDRWKDGSEIYCIDTFRGNKEDATGKFADLVNNQEGLIEIFKANTGEFLEKHIFPIGSSSANASRHWALNQNPPIDFIFIDACHEYEGVRQDILRWLPLMADDGVMVGHDYRNSAFPGVTQAVDELFGEDVTSHGEMNAFWQVNLADLKEGLPDGTSRPEGSTEDTTTAPG